MNPEAILQALAEKGLDVTLGAPGKLRVLGPENDWAKSILKLNRLAIIDHLEARCPLPYIKPDGTLVIPIGAAPRFRWWDGGQGIDATLQQINAPAEVIARYCEGDKG